MTRRTTRDRLEDIRAAAQDAQEFCRELNQAAFAALPLADRRTYRALKNVFAEIGEAVKLLPPELLADHPEVDWRGWAGLRDVVSHQYFSLEVALMRSTIMGELPTLLNAVLGELAKT